MSVTQENKSVAKFLNSCIGGVPSVSKFWDEKHKKSLDIMRLEGVPSEELVTITTIGLSDHDIDLVVDGVPLRVELIIGGQISNDNIENILATCASQIIDLKIQPKPGVVVKDVMKIYHPELRLEHILLTSPYIWDLKTLDFPSKKVAWLFGVPISDAEFFVLREKGLDDLETLFEVNDVNVFDLNRPGVVS